MAEMLILSTEIRCNENPRWALENKVSSQLGWLIAKAERFAESASLTMKRGR